MNGKWFSLAVFVLAAIVLLSLSSCARNQHLVSISVIPPGPVTFQGVGASIQFKALGTYAHPPETKDITNQVQWSVDSQNLVTINGPGLVTAISICGSGNVMASLNAPPNYIFGTAFVTGAGIGTAACNSALLTVNVSGSGTVTSSSGGINCPGTCSGVFPLGSSVELTATPSTGHTFGGWTNCASTSNICAVTMSANVMVGATFN
jgi:Divergent InlB B-repeat domain